MSGPPTNLTFGEMPPAQQSMVRRWYSSAMAGGNVASRAKIHAAAAGKSVRQGGEALLVAGMLGAMSVELPTGLDHKGMPMDAVLGVTNLLAGVFFAHEEYGSDLTNIGATCLSVFAYRKVQELMAERKKAHGGTPGFAAGKTMTARGDFDFGAESGEDPIIAAARTLP